MTTTDDQNRTARQHQRDVLNSIIDLLESLPDQQQRSETILSALLSSVFYLRTCSSASTTRWRSARVCFTSLGRRLRA